jgi:hypothetical protein
MKAFVTRRGMRGLLCGLGLLAAAGSTGCQVSTGGQTLPSAYYLKDDIQYYPAGPEFKLSAEAAQMKLYNEQAAQQAQQQQQQGHP